MEKVYYIEGVSCCMPYYTECKTYNYGVLEKYVDKEYNVKIMSENDFK